MSCISNSGACQMAVMGSLDEMGSDKIWLVFLDQALHIERRKI